MLDGAVAGACVDDEVDPSFGAVLKALAEFGLEIIEGDTPVVEKDFAVAREGNVQRLLSYGGGLRHGVEGSWQVSSRTVERLARGEHDKNEQEEHHAGGGGNVVCAVKGVGFDVGGAFAKRCAYGAVRLRLPCVIRLSR